LAAAEERKNFIQKADSLGLVPLDYKRTVRSFSSFPCADQRHKGIGLLGFFAPFCGYFIFFCPNPGRPFVASSKPQPGYQPNKPYRKNHNDDES
jgi:hypothetical protein